MLQDLLALLDKPFVLLIVMTIGGVIGIALENALNRPEGKVFKALDRIVIARNPGWQVMAQVSLGGSEAVR